MELEISSSEVKKLMQTFAFADRHLLVKRGECPHCGKGVAIPALASEEDKILINMFILTLKKTVMDIPEAAERVHAILNSHLFEDLY